MTDPNDITPKKRQDTIELILDGVNALQDGVEAIKLTMVQIERRTDSALDLAFQAHETAKTALWAKSTWSPFAASAIALGVAVVALGVAILR